MKITIKIKKGKDLSKKEIDLMNKYRMKEFGPDESINFKKTERNSLFFFAKENNKIVAFGMLKPIIVTYLNKKYSIFGLGNLIAIKKKKGYGKLIMNARVTYAKKQGKTTLAFTERKRLGFFKKIGMKTKLNLIRRFRYKNPKTGEVIKDNIGDGIYYEGKDKLITKILKSKAKSKSLAYINTPFW